MPRLYRDLDYPVVYDVVGEPMVTVPVAGYDWANIAAITNTTTGVLTVVGSSRQTGPWAAIGSGITITGQACSGPFSVSGIAWLGVKCTTADAGKTGTVYVFMSEGA